MMHDESMTDESMTLAQVFVCYRVNQNRDPRPTLEPTRDIIAPFKIGLLPATSFANWVRFGCRLQFFVSMQPASFQTLLLNFRAARNPRYWKIQRVGRD